MTARVIDDLAADVLCVVEAENRPSLARFNDELLGGRYGHSLLIDGNDLRGIDVGLFCIDAITVALDAQPRRRPRPADARRRLFSRDCPVHQLRLPGGEDLYLLLNHLKSQSFSSGDPDPLRSRQSAQVRAIYDGLRAEGAGCSPCSATSTRAGPTADRHPTPGAAARARLAAGRRVRARPFSQLFDDKDVDRERPGSFQSCALSNRLDYILLSPELAERVTDGGVFRKGLWGNPSNVNPPRPWSVYPEITAARHAASDHGAVWVDLDL